MSIKCLMNGLEVNYPCSPVCVLFGDCVTAFESQKKANVRTNADRIRAMSDEELAEFIKHIKVRAALCKAVKNNDAFEALCSAEWLKQPAEEGTA